MDHPNVQRHMKDANFNADKFSSTIWALLTHNSDASLDYFYISIKVQLKKLEICNVWLQN